LTAQDIASMERETETLGRDFKIIEESHRRNVLNVRLEILGADREHPEHREAEQWNPVSFERWYRDLRRAIVAVATTGNPTRRLPGSASIQLKAYVPAKCDWRPCERFMSLCYGASASERDYLVHPATYAEEAGGPLRRVFAVLYDVDTPKPGWTNMRLELLGIDHEHPEHREAVQWNEANFLAWSRDLRRGLLALGATGDPCNFPQRASRDQIASNTLSKSYTTW
jgi:hypothetical protein